MTDITENQLSATMPVEEITDGGERVTHLYPNDCYFAHLSIYHFASRFCQDGVVLDAGSGAGYGSAYLATHGAQFVQGIDISEKAVRFSQEHFQYPNLVYQTMSLENISGFPQRSCDLIFSSNTLEHIADVSAFFRAAWRLLKPEGVLLISVPPITRDVDWAENIANRYHLNIWTPRQWEYMLNQYFNEITPYWHGFNKPGVPLDFHNTPEQTVIDEQDFVFKPIELDEYYHNLTLGVLFVARNTRRKRELPSPRRPMVFVDGSFTRPPHASGAPPPYMVFRSRAYTIKHLMSRVRKIAREQGPGEAAKRIFYHLLRKLASWT